VPLLRRGRFPRRMTPPVHRASPRRSAAADTEALATRRRRAAEELLEVRLRYRTPVLELEVRNPVHRTSYRVLLPEYPLRESALCTCTDFARRGLGTCKHVEAGWDWLRGLGSLPEAPSAPAIVPAPAETWNEIDRRLASLIRSGPRRVREVEAAGSVLFEGTPPPPAPPSEGPTAEGRGARRARPATRPTSRERP